MSVTTDMAEIDRLIKACSPELGAPIWERLKQRMKITTISDGLLNRCRFDLENWFATIVPENDVNLRELIESDVAFCVTLNAFYATEEDSSGGLDTSERDELTSILSHKLLDRSWPINMDPKEYTEQFMKDWAEKCKELGWTFNAS